MSSALPQADPSAASTLDAGGIDLGLLTILDPHALPSGPASSLDARLHALVLRNAQALVRAVFSLPVRVEDVGAVVALPPPVTSLPRWKRIPEPKPLTKWEAFAKAKGIQKKPKRSARVLNEADGTYTRRHGYDREVDGKAGKGKLDDWVIPVGANDDPCEWAAP